MANIAVAIAIDGNNSALMSKEKTFSTGSRGFWVGGKVQIGGKSYQMTGNLVEVGSKPKDGAAAPKVAGATSL